MSGSIAFLGYCKGCDQPMLDGGSLGEHEYDSDGQAVRHFWCEGTWKPAGQPLRGYSRLAPVARTPLPVLPQPVSGLPDSASPIEKMFWAAYQRMRPPALAGLVPQYRVDQYRIDFAKPDRLIGIELDGFRNHSRVTDIAKDRLRQRWLEGRNWLIIRFGGGEVVRDADHCIHQAAWLAANYRRGHLE